MNDISKLNPYESNYLLNLKEVYENDFSKIDLLNISQKQKDILYIYNMMMCQFLEISWHLFIDWKSNIQNFNINKIIPNTLDFRRFEVYNNIKWELDREYYESNEDFLLDYFAEGEIEIFSRIVKGFEPVAFIINLYNYYFVNFPIELRFKLEFLEPEFTDLKSFGEWFDQWPEYTENSYPSFMLECADRLSNEFASKYLL